MKKLLFIFSFALILGFTNLAFGQNVSLPAGVQNILNQNYPKWKIVKNVCQTAASGDFNGDKKTDYVAIITYQNGGSVVGFVSQGNDFRAVVVDSLSRKEAETSAVNPARKGSEVLVGGTIGDTDAKFAKLKSDGFYYGSCESDDGTAYIFKNNAFVSAYGDQGGNNGGNDRRDNTASNSGNSSGGKTYKDSRGVGTKYSLGDMSFADRVVSFKKGNPAPASANANSNDSLGKPDYNESRDEENYVTLGCAGVLTVEFVDNVLVDGNGNDLYVYEIGPNVEPTKVEISKDGKNWINVGNVSGSTSSLDISNYVSPNDEFRFVRLTDLKSACGSYPGADIDAIGAISSRRNDGGSTSNNQPPVNNNPPPISPGSRTVKLFFYKPKKGDTRCATNLVPVNRQISGSQSVLRESLNALFGDDDSGLDDYTTGLSLVNVSITNGVANIVVTGAQNSACASLFEEQVRKTAMQFPTVKQVNIKFQD